MYRFILLGFFAYIFYYVEIDIKYVYFISIVKYKLMDLE